MLAAMLAALAAFSGCGLLPGETREVVSIPPASAGPSSDSGFGPEVRALSFGPGDKGSPRMSPSGEKVSFILDGRVAEKPLYSQDQSFSTGEDLRAEHAEWLPDGTLATVGMKEGGQGAGSSVSSSLFAVGEDASTDEREIVERVEATGGSRTAGSWSRRRYRPRVSPWRGRPRAGWCFSRARRSR